MKNISSSKRINRLNFECWNMLQFPIVIQFRVNHRAPTLPEQALVLQDYLRGFVTLDTGKILYPRIIGAKRQPLASVAKSMPTGRKTIEVAKMKEKGTVRAIGITSHQREFAARLAKSRLLDCLMIRYNAAHRGAEEEIFPTTKSLEIPVISYTGLRWGTLLENSPSDPPGFMPPRAIDCYRFTLCNPAVTVSLMAPNGRTELEENLDLLNDWRGMNTGEYEKLKEHGDRIHQHAPAFP